MENLNISASEKYRYINARCQMKLDKVIDLSQNLDEKNNDFIDYIGRNNFITIIFCLLFLIGLFYYISYFGYFGINHIMLTFPVFVFLVQAIIPIISGVLFIIMFLYIIRFKPNPKAKNIYIHGILSIIAYFFTIKYVFPQIYPPFFENFFNYLWAGILMFFFYMDLLAK